MSLKKDFRQLSKNDLLAIIRGQEGKLQACYKNFEEAKQIVLECQNKAIEMEADYSIAREENGLAVQALEQELFELKKAKKPKHRLVASSGEGVIDIFRAELGLEALRAYAKKAGLEVLVVKDYRSGGLPVTRRFKEMKDFLD